MQQTILCLIVSCLLLLLLADPSFGCVHHDYCVVGAGPAGLQIGYFLSMAGRDYIVFEKSNRSGNFFELYPRHRKLISLNKRHTGTVNAEYNLRHDWNSLISHDDSLKMTKYSKDMFPHADTLLQYLDDYQKKLNISVQFDTTVQNVRTVDNVSAPDGHFHIMEDQRGNCYTCKALIMATGIATPNIPPIEGVELTQGYESVSIDPEDFEGKSVLILGRGNAAFEVADNIMGSTNFIHMISRSRVRLSWETHYVGDLRAVNNGLLDTYQLKSLDGVLESTAVDLQMVKKDGKIYAVPKGITDEDMDHYDNYALREPYDFVIRALGFTFDDSIFNKTEISRGRNRKRKYPAIFHNYESVMTKGLFYAGTATHSLDFRKSAGGFIHGFRYTARALHRLLEWRYENVPWPSVTVPSLQLSNLILKRINEASGPYQMFHILGDIILLSKDGQSVTYLEEFPINLLPDLPNHTGHNVSSLIVMVMEYGKNFSGPGKDTFAEDRATADPSEAHTSNFLHPVLYYYKSLPTKKMMKLKDRLDVLPRPDMIHHVLEDFLVRWDGQFSHILPLRRFLEHMWQTDLKTFFSQTCFHYAMTYGSVPGNCEHGYLEGRGLFGTQDQIDLARSHGVLDLS